MGKIHIGTSGWGYADWDFYGDLPDSKRLSFYAKTFKTVEVNTTFYHLPTAKTVKNWDSQVPKSFLFSIKASRYITHIKRLNDARESLSLLYRRIRYLDKKLGPILFQLPPSFHKDMERLEGFVRLLKPKHKYVFEFRSPTWFDDEVYAYLKKNKIALCISDLNGLLSPQEVTANFVYIRLHGPAKAYQGKYGKKRLTSWAQKIQDWVKKKKTVYIYFDNDQKGYAVEDAKTLATLL